MRRTVRAIFWLFLVLLYGCSATNDVIGHGPFEKRKYRPGWHVELGHRMPGPTERTMVQRETVPRLAVTCVQPEERIPTAEPLSASAVAKPPIGADPSKRWCVPQMDVEIRPVTLPQRKIMGALDEQTTEEPRRWNRMALVSGAFLLLAILVAATGGGAIIGYIFTFSVITGVIGLVLAIKNKERGKGIAIAAIAFPIAVLALVIAALNTAW